VNPQRPYLLRALYDWLIDNDEVPYVVIDVSAPGVQVPAEHAVDGQLVLNLGPSAIRDLVMEKDFVMCSSRFNGRAVELYLPMASVRAIYGRDSREGMVFPDETFALEAGGEVQSVDDRQVTTLTEDADANQADKPSLRLV